MLECENENIYEATQRQDRQGSLSMDKRTFTQERPINNGNNSIASENIQTGDKRMNDNPYQSEPRPERMTRSLDEICDDIQTKLDKLKETMQKDKLGRCSHCKTIFPASCLDRVGMVGNQEITDLLCPGCLYCFRHNAPRFDEDV